MKWYDLRMVPAFIWLAAALALNTGAMTGRELTAVPAPPCPFHAITGLQCPGCGMGRALIALADMDLRAALRLNPFSIVLLLMVLMQVFPFREKVDRWLVHYRCYEFLAAVLMLWWFMTRVL
jgi:hypothetical protein